MQRHRTSGALRIRWMLAVAALGLAPIAHAQSDGRIAPRLTGDWQGPEFEDFAVFVKAANKDDGSTPEKRKKSIAAVKELLSSGKVNGATKANLMAKLAELTATLVDEAYVDELHDYERAYSVFIEGDGQGAAPKAVHDKSRSLARQSIEVHRNLIEAFPKFRKRADVQLRLAVLLGRTASPNALPAFEQLMQTAAGTRAGQLAAIGAGDMLTADGKMTEAGAKYKKALKGKDGQAKRYARYRLAWLPLERKAGKTLDAAASKKALGAMKSLTVKGCKDVDDNDDATPATVLCHELRLDLVYLFAATGRETDAKAFFKKTGDKEGYFLTLERSGNLQAKAGKPVDAADQFETILKEGPTRGANPRVYAALASAWDKAGRPAAVCQALTGMKKSYLDDGAWRDANEKDKRRVDDAESLTQKTTLSYAKAYAERNKANPERSILIASNCSYGLYVAAFPKSEGIMVVRFSYGEGLGGEGRNEDAARQYFIVAEAGREGEALANAAAERMLMFQEKVMVQARSTMPAVDVGKAKVDDPLSASETLWVAIVDLYAKFFPMKERIPALKLDAARVYLTRGHYKSAVQRLDALAKASPKTNEAQVGVKLVIALYNAQKNYVEVIHWAKEFHGHRDLVQDVALKGFLRESWRLGMWDLAEQLQGKKEIQPAAKAFVAYQEEFPQAANADLALARASSLYLGLGKGKDGIRACETLITSYPPSALRPACRLTVADVYEQLLEYEQAAISEAAFGLEYPKDDRALKAMMKAAELYVNAQNSDMAVVTFNQILARYPGKPEAGMAQLRLAEVRESVGEIDEALGAYQKFSATFGASHLAEKLYADAKVAALMREHRDGRDGLARLAAVEKGLVSLPENAAIKARNVAARERLDVAMSLTPEARDWHISYADYEAFKRTFAALTQKLDLVSKEYLRVVTDGDPEQGVAAYYYLGNMYEAATRAAKAPPLDSDLTPDALADAVSKRETFLADAQKQMSGHWEAGYALAKSKDRHEQWRSLTRAKLAKMSPGKYKESPEEILQPTFTSHRLSNAVSVD